MVPRPLPDLTWPGDVFESEDGGDDRIYAGPGADACEGGPGDDFLDCGEGTDSADGGPGEDTATGCEAAVNVEILL